MSFSINPTQQLASEVEENRQSEYSINPLFLNRWSPRAYSEQKISDEELYKILEAATWAPSSFNDQPWRFFVAKTENQLKTFHEFLNPFNLTWAKSAPVLVLLTSNKKRENGDPNSAHTFDAGTAWGHLSLQATLLGLSTHAIGGFDKEKARSLLNVPDDFDLHVVISIGYRGKKETLSESLQEREQPSTRKPLKDVLFEGNINQ
ncbi:nitroreductase family protein [Neobacillus cucumis]|uniref:nitroreductase family protein n=1 Tax=Neobacillus cucumis TaxID=1740721 RepID=UPI0028536F57|nr:nitroreductase family protein [Neobacillus cucumis]MDR4947299.1 nitroreductase family protein [Neobacillus cucumis]